MRLLGVVASFAPRKLGGFKSHMVHKKACAEGWYRAGPMLGNISIPDQETIV